MSDSLTYILKIIFYWCLITHFGFDQLEVA